MANSLSKKGLVFCTVLLLAGIALLPGICCGASILGTSSSFGNTFYVGGGPGRYSSIQSAINAANNGDTVFVYDDLSPYYENIIIDKSISLEGEDKNTTIIDGSGNKDVVYVSADGVAISGFTVRNGGNDWIDAGIKLVSDYNTVTGNIVTDSNFGVYSYNLEYSTISGNLITDNADSGINLPFSSDNTISGNTIIGNNNYGIFLYDSSLNGTSQVLKNVVTNNHYGIYLWHTNNIDIHWNTVTESEAGIQLFHGSKNNIIYGNNIANNKYGIKFNTSSYNKIYWDNIISDNKYGIYYNSVSYSNIYDGNIFTGNDYGIYLSQSSFNNIYDGNIFTGNDYGICLLHSPNNEIHENEVTNNEYGVSLDFSSSNDLYGNSIGGNGYGIYISDSSNNEIYLNDITGNYQAGLHLCFCRSSKIAFNNFITNYVPAYFEQSFLSSSLWKQNYWDVWGGNGPQLIYGELSFLGGLISMDEWPNFDLRPAEQPYEIIR